MHFPVFSFKHKKKQVIIQPLHLHILMVKKHVQGRIGNGEGEKGKRERGQTSVPSPPGRLQTRHVWAWWTQEVRLIDTQYEISSESPYSGLPFLYFIVECTGNFESILCLITLRACKSPQDLSTPVFFPLILLNYICFSVFMRPLFSSLLLLNGPTQKKIHRKISRMRPPKMWRQFRWYVGWVLCSTAGK